MSDSSEGGGFPDKGRLLGIDFGTKRIGIAVCDWDQSIAGPVENYTRQTRQLDALHFEAVVQDYEAIGLVVGLPVHMSGDEGGKARQARSFGNWLGGQLGLPVCFWDERYTSAAAEDHLAAANLSSRKRKARMDMVAAHVLLQSFLDAPDRDLPPQSY